MAARPAVTSGSNSGTTQGNTLVTITDDMTDEEATLVVTAGTAMYGLTELGGLVAGESVVVTGPGPIGLLGVAVAKALGAQPVILTGTRDNRLEIGKKLGADYVVNVRNHNVVEQVRELNGGKGVDYVLECSAAPNAINEAAQMVNQAKGYAQARLNRAQGEANRFLATLKEYNQSRDTISKRIYIETMEEILPKMDKIIIDGKAGERMLPYLPLDRLSKKPPTPTEGRDR